jgi:hypothetical protein
MRDAVDKERALYLSLALAKQLSPYITRQTITQRTVHYRISRGLLDHEVIADWIGKDNVPAWYEALTDYYGWNARFWEQRALAEAARGQFDKAESYAARAVGILDDAYSLNTYGTILMRKTIEWFDPESPSANEYYWRGVRELGASVNKDKLESHYPYITFFRHTYLYVEKAFPNRPIDPGIQHEWNRWYNFAKFAPPFQHPDLFTDLSNYLEDWLTLNVTHEPK